MCSVTSNAIVDGALPVFATLLKFLDRERTVAKPSFNRWLVPPAALCIHLSIGMAYGFSVFWLPLTRAVGIDHSVPYPAGMPWYEKWVMTSFDWDKPLLGWMYTLFFVFLGSSAALFGRWLERAGPRKAGLASAICWCGGLALGSLGVYWHQLWLLWLGTGVIGGIGLGLGYISPVSTLIKWFPDRRGMATGMAIMGFGGGAMIGSPLADLLMKHFATQHSVGVWETLLCLSVIYGFFMVIGSLAYRVPPVGWTPQGWHAPTTSSGLTTARHVHVDRAWKTPQFWLLWCVLCLNVSAGIGVLGMASPMFQEIFGGRLIGLDTDYESLDREQSARVAAIAAGFTGLLSLFNIGGRFFWASLSDVIGRYTTYTVFFVMGIVLYATAPTAARLGGVLPFVMIFCVVFTLYGGGFAAIPAYLADLFGTHMVGAIHGRLLTAWSVAGVVGPVLVNYLNDAQVRAGVPKSLAYDTTLYVLALLLLIGLACNLMVRPVADRWFMTDEELARERGTTKTEPTGSNTQTQSDTIGSLVPTLSLWAMVMIPASWGVWVTIMHAATMVR